MFSKLNKVAGNPLKKINFDDLQVNRKYNIKSAHKIETKYGSAVYLRLYLEEDVQLFLPTHIAESIDEKDITTFCKGGSIIEYLGRDKDTKVPLMKFE